MGHRQMLGCMLSVGLLVGLLAAPAALAQDKPQKGGICGWRLLATPPAWTCTRRPHFW